jgi:hypothetical protein
MPVSDWQAVLALAPSLTVTGLLLVVVVAFTKEWIVPGSVHRRVQRENTQLLNIAFRLGGVAKTATDVITLIPPEDGDR